MIHLRIGRVVVVVAVLGALIWAVTARAIHRVENASSGPRPAPVGSGALAGLVQKAWEAWQRGQEAIKRGDWSAYGQAQKELEGLLRQLREAR